MTKQPPITLGDVAMFLSEVAYQREQFYAAFDRKGTEQPDVRRYLLAANIVFALRERPDLWKELKREIARGASMTRETGDPPEPI